VEESKKNDELRSYLLKNPDKLRGDYAYTADMFNTTYESVRHQARRLRAAFDEELKAASYSSAEVPEEKVITNEKKDSLLVSVENSSRVKSLDDLITNCNVDLSTWEVDWFDIGTYEVTGFDNDRKPITVTMYRTKAKFKKIDVWKNIAILKEDLKQDLFETFQSYALKPTFNTDTEEGEGYLLEVGAYDLHLGKLGISGDDYSLDVARDRLFSAIDSLFHRARGFRIEEIVFVVGNDFLNIDRANPFNSTTAGTPQSNTVSAYEAYRYGRKLLVEAINLLSKKAPVRVVVVPGNHDEESMLHMGDALEALYETTPHINVDNSRPLMKAYKYGECLLIFDHGNRVKNYKNLASVISQRFRDVWSSVRHIEVHRGHLHSLKSSTMGQVEELNGIAVRHLGSMSPTDQWHDDSGYLSTVKRAHAFVWHKKNGMQCEYYYNVPVG
jgi:hypothetical protein|tara:strand:- start:58 stop:1383 length:1326 start_codon:yes stop_codon:yes gene_type:complete